MLLQTFMQKKYVTWKDGWSKGKTSSIMMHEKINIFENNRLYKFMAIPTIFLKNGETPLYLQL